METRDELLQKAEAAHGHLCAGQILGVRMALLGLGRVIKLVICTGLLEK